MLRDRFVAGTGRAGGCLVVGWRGVGGVAHRGGERPFCFDLFSLVPKIRLYSVMIF